MGWAFLWLKWDTPALEPIKPDQHALGFPDGDFVLKLKLFKVRARVHVSPLKFGSAHTTSHYTTRWMVGCVRQLPALRVLVLPSTSVEGDESAPKRPASSKSDDGWRAHRVAPREA